MLEPTFKDFDPAGEVEVYWTDLPHWRQEGATYFVTFRLADSIPRRILQHWAELRDNWCQAHGLVRTLEARIWNERYRAIPEAERRVFERQQLGHLLVELDRCHGSSELRNSEAASIVADSLSFFDRRLLRCGDFIVLPTHVHWLVLPYSGIKLEGILQSTKRYSATRINQILNRSGRLWQPGSFDHIVRDRDELSKIREYIQENGVNAGLSPDDYFYYRADWL